MIKERDDDYFIDKMSTLGKVMWRLYVVEIFRDGDGGSFIYNKYHPLSYVLLLISILILFWISGSEGVKEEWDYNKMCWDFTDYWKKPKNKIRYIPRPDIYFYT